MINSIIVGTALAFVTGAPVYATDGPSAPAAPKVATVVACEAYVYKGTTTNLCGAHATAKDLDCTQLVKPVQLVTKGTDPWRLDSDGDGIGCDLEPGPAASSSSAAPAKSSRPDGATPATSRPPATSDAAAGPQLPLTGPSAWVLASVGVMALGVGGAAAVAGRRRQARFEA